MKVPQIDVVRQYKALKDEIDRGVLDVLESGKFILGPWVRDLEEKGTFVGVPTRRVREC